MVASLRRHPISPEATWAGAVERPYSPGHPGPMTGNCLFVFVGVHLVLVHIVAYTCCGRTDVDTNWDRRSSYLVLLSVVSRLGHR